MVAQVTRRIRSLAQTRSAAGRRALREGLREAITRAGRAENPNVAALVTRQALAGYGRGLGEVVTGAQEVARKEQREQQALEIQRQQTIFSAAMQDYMARFGRTTSQVQSDLNTGFGISSKGPPGFSIGYGKALPKPGWA